MDKKPQAEEEPLTDSLANDTTPTDSITQLVEEEPMPVTADELFDDFFFNYVASRKVQKQRTVFPLPVNKYGKHSVMQAANWKREHFFMNQGYYILIFNKQSQLTLMKDTAVGNVVVEKIMAQSDAMTQWHFARKRGNWMLDSVSYKSLHHHPDAAFLRFYQKFAADSAFQQQSLAEEISFTGPDPDDDFATMTGDILPEQWDMFKPWLPSGTLYNIRYGQDAYPASNVRFFYIRGIANGLQTDLIFTRKGKSWQLKKVNT